MTKYIPSKAAILLSTLCLLFLPTIHAAQRPDYSKLSPMLRKLTRETSGVQNPTFNPQDASLKTQPSPLRMQPSLSVCAFVKVAEGGEEVLRQNGCRILTQVGDICIADIPQASIGRLSLDSRILRIEANHSNHLLTDSLATYLNALPVYDGQSLPQPFTGRGVVVGIMDVGFDLTHPNFYTADTTDYRIRAFWDMLSADTIGSTFYVGRDYSGRDTLLSLAHSRDGLKQTHGTHTLGIAAGSGYNSPYRGMAYESDICIVANAVTEDTIFIDPDDYYKYTFATDALGFKYIFDYAESQGKPCVINFSEGSQQDFWGYDVLYYEMLERLTGPGRILVVAAGNNGTNKGWFRKPAGQSSAGAFYRVYEKNGMLTAKTDHDCSLRLVAYDDDTSDTLLISSQDVLLQEDSMVTAQFNTGQSTLNILIEAYPSCYNPQETCFDITFNSKQSIGGTPALSFEVIGEQADIEVYAVNGFFRTDNYNPELDAGEYTHSILSPASAPCAICVGANNYRPNFQNYLGIWYNSLSKGENGERSPYSSVGPTMDGRIKPDVMAPGISIISSYNSYFVEDNPTDGLLSYIVDRFQFNERTYDWQCSSGTSMASPAVAGAIALWLQANPTLTPDDIIDVLSHTCRHYDPSLTYPNNEYGYGEIDVYAGLLYILEASNIEGVSTTHSDAHVSYADGQLTIDLGHPCSTPTLLRIFSLKGTQLFSATLPPHQTTHSLTLPRLQEAIYVVQLNAPGDTGSSTLIAVK